MKIRTEKNIEQELIDRASKRIKPLLDARDDETLKVLLQMCQFIGGEDFSVEMVPQNEEEEELAKQINRKFENMLSPYRDLAQDDSSGILLCFQCSHWCRQSNLMVCDITGLGQPAIGFCNRAEKWEIEK